jgi:hypothetical protein
VAKVLANLTLKQHESEPPGFCRPRRRECPDNLASSIAHSNADIASRHIQWVAGEEEMPGAICDLLHIVVGQDKKKRL